MQVVRTNLLLDAEEAARKTVEEDAKIVGVADLALAGAGLAMGDEGGAAAELVEAARAAHGCDAVVVEDVAREVARCVELLPTIDY